MSVEDQAVYGLAKTEAIELLSSLATKSSCRQVISSSVGKSEAASMLMSPLQPLVQFLSNHTSAFELLRPSTITCRQVLHDMLYHVVSCSP